MTSALATPWDTSTVNTGKKPPNSDPADALTRMGCLVLLIGGFLLFQLPRSVAGIVNGDSAERLGAALGLALAAWLTWRTVLLFRHSSTASNRRYWAVSAAGYAFLTVLFAAYYAWLISTRSQDTRHAVSMTISMALLLSLTALTIFAGRKVDVRRNR